MKVKKIVSALVTAVMCVQALNMSAFAGNEKKREILFSDTFDGYVTNDVPEKGIYSADNVRVVDRVAQKDKAVSFKVGSSTSAKYMLDEKVQQAVMSFDLKLSGTADITISIIDDADKQYKLLTQKQDGCLVTATGCPVGSIGGQIWQSVAIAYNGIDKSYDAYLNGKSIAQRWAVSAGPEKIAGFRLEFSSDHESSCEIDNVVAYKGTEIIKSVSFKAGKYGGSGYNSEKIDYVPDDDDYDEDSKNVAFNRTFEEEGVDDLEGFAPQDRGGKSEIYVDTDVATGNRYLKHHINGQTTDCYTVFSIKTQNSFEVVQFDAKYGKNPMDGFQVRTVNEKGTFIGFLMTAKNGAIYTYKDGVATDTLGKMTDRWQNFAFVIDKNSKKFDMYINGECVYENAGPFGDETFGELSAAAFHTWSSGKDDDLFFDNIRAYDGKAIREIGKDEEVNRTSILISNEYSEKLLKNSVSVHEASDYIFYDGERHVKTLPGYKTEDGVLMEAAEELEKAFGFTMEQDAAGETVKINGIELKIGSCDVTVNGRQQKLKAAPEMKDGKLYLPFADTAEMLLGKKLFYNDRGIYIAKAQTMRLEEKDIKAVNDYMLYPRYEPEEIKELFRGKEDMHPRVLINSDGVEEMRRKYAENEYMHVVGDAIIKIADGLVTKTTSPPKFEATGQLLNQARTVYDRMCNLGTAYLLTGDRRYVDRAWIELQAVCGDTYPEWRLDHLITASEMAVGVAIAYDWMYDEWTEEQREFIEQALMEKYIRPSEKKYFMGNTLYYHVADNTNRGIVNNGGSVVLGIALFDKDPDLCSSLISCGLRAMEYAEDMFYPDGAWHEGVGYWVYMSDYLVNAVGTIEATFGDDFNILNTPGMNKSVYFSVYSTGPTGTDNFEDAHYNNGQTPVYMWYARKYNIPGIANLRRFNTNDGKSGPGVKDLLFYDTAWENEDIEELPLDKTFAGVEYASMRNDFFDKDATYLGLHGGKAKTSHGHLDNGTFVVDMIGERWAWDLAGSNYAFVDAHKDVEFYLYERSPEGHNCLVINPTEESYYQNIDATSYITKQESKERGAYTVMDLTSAYYENANEAIRGYRLTAERSAVEIRDELKLKSESDVYWFMQTKADISISEDGREAILEQNGKRVKLSFITDAPNAEMTFSDPAAPLEVTPVIEGQVEKTGFKRLEIKLSGKKDMYIHVRMIPESNSESNSEIENVSISDWTIPDGKLELMPKLDMIYCNGQPISEFEDTKTMYNVLVEDVETSPFEITANDGEGYTVEITEEKGDGKITKTVRATNNNNPKLYRDYTVVAEQPKQLPDVGGMKRLPVYEYMVSSEIQEANNRYNANDNDLNTRFTMEGKDEWITYDLGKQQRIDGIGVAVWKAAERNTSYDIYVSDDNENWTKVYSGGNEGKADEIELKNITPVNARYVKLVGFGSNVNAYTNILELAVLQNK